MSVTGLTNSKTGHLPSLNLSQYGYRRIGINYLRGLTFWRDACLRLHCKLLGLSESGPGTPVWRRSNAAPLDSATVVPVSESCGAMRV